MALPLQISQMNLNAKPAALGINVLLRVYTASWITRSILRLVKATEAISNGELDQIVQGSKIHEINVLAVAFNWMAKQLRSAFMDLETRVFQITEALENTLQELKQAQTHLVQTEKMSALGQMVAGLLTKLIILLTLFMAI